VIKINFNCSITNFPTAIGVFKKCLTFEFLEEQYIEAQERHHGDTSDLGRPIGFLKGSADMKFSEFKAPVLDTLANLYGGQERTNHNINRARTPVTSVIGN
jgi:hypothetical protein